MILDRSSWLPAGVAGAIPVRRIERKTANRAPLAPAGDLYGDGDASKDRSQHKWIIYAIDKRTGKTVWTRTAHEGVPLEKRHIKSTYANSTPGY